MARRGFAGRPAVEPRLYRLGEGHDGEVNNLEDFAKCSPARQRCIIEAMQTMVSSLTDRVQRAEEIYRETVEQAEKNIVDDRHALADFMAFYVGATQIVARRAAMALEAPLPTSRIEAQSVGEPS